MVSDLQESGNNRFLVGKAADLPPGHRKIVNANGLEIGVFNIKGNFYALRNKCPHKGGPICKGRIRPLIVSHAVYECEFEREDEILKCPWHQWEFEIESGIALCDQTLRVQTFPVTQEGENIFLQLE